MKVSNTQLFSFVSEFKSRKFFRKFRMTFGEINQLYQMLTMYRKIEGLRAKNIETSLVFKDFLMAFDFNSPHTHTHTHIYIYIYTFPLFFLMIVEATWNGKSWTSSAHEFIIFWDLHPFCFCCVQCIFTNFSHLNLSFYIFYFLPALIYKYIYIYMYLSIYLSIHTHTHTHIYIYIYI